MLMNKRPRIRLLEFKVTSWKAGSYNEYHLLKELSKKDYYQNHVERPFSTDNGDRDIYVDIKTKKLWIRTGEAFKIDEFERKAIEFSLEKNVDIDSEPSNDLVNLKILKDTLVEWWCK